MLYDHFTSYYFHHFHPYHFHPYHLPFMPEKKKLEKKIWFLSRLRSLVQIKNRGRGLRAHAH